jgi:cobalamin-dependent methionine synthase I
MDGILAMRKDYDFSVGVLLKNNEQSEGLKAKEAVENLYLSAKKIYEKAVVDYGLKPQDIFFELNTYPLISELQKGDNRPGFTHVTFETAKKIAHDKKMQGVHCLMRPSMACIKLKRSIGITRAYLSRALEYGFDSAFVNVSRQYGRIEPNPELIKHVDAFIGMDGLVEHKEIAAAQIKGFLKD